MANESSEIPAVAVPKVAAAGDTRLPFVPLPGTGGGWAGFKVRAREFFRQTRLDLFPLRHWLRGYTRAQARDDAQAAINVALLDLPMVMAYALVAGLPVKNGLYCAVTSTILGPIWASSRFIILGPSNATAVLLMSTLAALSMTPEDALVAVPVLVLLVGFFLTLGALLRLDSLVQFISHSVVTGYITAAAFLIVINQIPSALGLHTPKAANLVAGVRALADNLQFADAPSAGIAVATIALCLGLKRWAPKTLPNVALTIILIAALTAAVGAWAVSHGILWHPEMLPALTPGAWHPTLPAFDLQRLHQLANGALAIAFMAMMESTAISKALATLAGERVNTNQQMLSLGLVNLANAFTGGMPASGSPTRSTFTAGTTAGTPMVSMFSGLIVLVIIVTLGRFLAFVPHPALAALIILVGLSLIHGQQIQLILRTTKSDAAVFLITFLGGLTYGLDSGIYLGTAASIVLFLKKVSAPQLVEIAFNDKGELTERDTGSASETPEISIVHVEGELFFGASELFYEQARLLVESHRHKIIILRMRNARHLDATCALALRDLIRLARTRGSDVLVSGASADLERVFRNSGLMDTLGEKNFHRIVPHNPNISTRNALKRAQEILGTPKADITIFTKPKPPENPPPPESTTVSDPGSLPPTA